MSANRSIEKFSVAARHLASSPHPLPERLQGALCEIVATLRHDEFRDDEARQRWQAIRDRMHRESAIPDGTIANAIAGMSEEEATRLAGEIYDITILLHDLGAGRYSSPPAV